MHKASKIFGAGSESEQQFIAKCMSEVYGNDATASLSLIDESMQPVEI